MIDKLFESVYNLFEEDEEKVNYERSDVEISPVVYSVELYVNDKLQEDYYEKFENKDDAIEYSKKLLNMIGKDEKFTVSVLSYNTESGKIKVEWRETNQKWGEGFFEADENDEMKSILESTGYYDELSNIHNTGLAGNYDETLEKVSKEDYKELKDEKAVQVEGLNESISEEAQEKLWKNGFLFDMDRFNLGPEDERDYVKSYTDKENNISWRPYLGNEEKDMFYIKGDHSGKLYSLDEIIDIKKGIKKLEPITESNDEESVSYQIDIMSSDKDGRTEEILDEKRFENKDTAINYAKEQLKQLKTEYYDVFADLYRVTPILNYDTKEYEESFETIAQIMSNGYVELLESDENNRMTIMDFCDKMELTKDHGSLIMDKLDCDDWDSTKFTIQELYKAMDDCKDTDRDNWDELFESMDYNYVKMDYLDNHDRETAIKKLIEIGEATNREDAEIEIDDWDEEDELWDNDEENLNEGTKDLHKFETKNWSKDDEKRLYALSRKNPQEMSDDEWKEFQKLEKRSSGENKKWVKSLSEDTLRDIVHPVQAVSIDAIDRIIKKYGYEITDVIDISEQDGKHEYNCMLEIFPDFEHYEKKNLDKDVNTLEKTLKNKLGTNNIKVKHVHDSNGLNVYFYYSEYLDEDTEKQNGKWVNKGKEGTHGTFKTKKEADAQRKAMFANGYKG